MPVIELESLAYRAYHATVMHHVRKELRRQWPPRTSADEVALDQAARFFDGCTYVEDFFEDADPDEVASDNIQAAS